MKRFRPVIWAIITSYTLCAQAKAGLLSMWNFEEGTGTLAHDSMLVADGTLFGSATWAVGGGLNGGTALQLNKATNDYVSMGDNFDWGPMDAFSIQAWVRLLPGDASYQIPVARHQSGYSNGYFLAVNDTGDGCSAIGAAHFYAGYPCSGVSGTGVNDGNWHHLIATFSSGIASIYVDGLLASASSGATAIGPSPSDFIVGGVLTSNGIQATFTGLVDDVAVWSHALSGREVADLYSSAAGVPEPGTAILLAAAAGIVLLRGLKQQ